MRILHLLSQTELTGAEVYAQNLITHQFHTGHSVFVISDKIHVSLPVPWESTPLSVNTWGQRRKNIKTLRSFIQANNIELIHCHSRAAVRVAHAARKGTPCAQVSTIHGRQHLSFGKRWLDIYGEYKLLVCDRLLEPFKFQLKADPGSLKVLRNPLPFSDHAPTPPPRPESVPFHKLRVAFIGRSSGPKGRRLQELCEGGFFQFLSENPNLKFDIIATNKQNFGDAFLKKAQKLGITFREDVKNLDPIYTEYDLIMGAGRVAIEALKQRVAVLAFGEYTCHGLVNEQNWHEVLGTNFGDIGGIEVESPLHTNYIINCLSEITKGQKTDLLQVSEKMWLNLKLEFDQSLINKQVEATYRAAIFKRHVPHWIPILMYHKIPIEALKSRHRIFITAQNFEKHLQFFRWLKFHPLSFSDLKKYWQGDVDYTNFPKKPILLTFDDGYKDNLHNAIPLLEKYQTKASFFLLADKAISQNSWDEGEADPLLSTEERQQLANCPYVEIGSHGINHLRFTELNDNELRHQMIESKFQLEKEFQRPIDCLAYPFGSTSNAIASQAAKAGYYFGVNTDTGGFHLADAPFSIFRVNMFPEDGFFSLWKKTSTWYRKRFYRKHKK